MPRTYFECEHPATPQATMTAITSRMRLPPDDLFVWFDAEHSGADLRPPQPYPTLAGFYALDNIEECPFPERVKARMTLDGYLMLVWVGRVVIEGNTVRLAVTLAHELRHVEQYAHEPQLHYANVGIDNCLVIEALLRGADRYNRWDSPTELDAEAQARQVVVSTLGEPAASEYYQRECREWESLGRFIHPVPIGTLDEVVDSTRQWLTEHYNDIVRLRRAAASPDFETHLARIRWDLFGLPGYPRHEIL